MRRLTVDPFSEKNTILIKTRLMSVAANRARRQGREFSLTLENFPELPEHCPVFGVKLEYFRQGKRDDASASLDRIDSSKGYIPGNVQVISWRANRLKSNATLAEVRRLADWMDAHEAFPW